jgi:CBS domain-containing protein
MSPRAAWQLEVFGFEQVFDLPGGKVQWLSRGFQTEGKGPHHATAGAVVKHDIPTCRVGDTVADVRHSIASGDEAFCVVLNDANVVLGRIRRRDLPEDDSQPVLEVMKPGPSTVRPVEELRPLIERMHRAGVGTILVTSNKGKLLGVVHRHVADRYLNEHSSPSVE